MPDKQPDDSPSHTDAHLLKTAFAKDDIPAIRRRLETVAVDCGLTEERVSDWVTAVNELMVNAIRHGDGGGQVCVWVNGDLYCEVRDRGPGFDAAPYRERRARPTPSASGGMGLWIAQRMSDDMSIDSGPTGTVVRLRTTLAG